MRYLVSERKPVTPFKYIEGRKDYGRGKVPHHVDLQPYEYRYSWVCDCGGEIIQYAKDVAYCQKCKQEYGVYKRHIWPNVALTNAPLLGICDVDDCQYDVNELLK